MLFFPAVGLLAFSIPDGRNGGRGGRFFSRAISSRSIWVSRRRLSFSSLSRSIVVTQALVLSAQRSDVRFELVHLADQTRNQPAHGTERQRLNRINRWQLHATLNQNSLRLKIYLPGNLVQLHKTPNWGTRVWILTKHFNSKW